MKSLEIKINGDLRLAGFTIGGRVSVADLPEGFAVGEESQCAVLGAMVSTRFATAQVALAEGPVNLQLRFEEGVWVSSFMTVAAIDGPYATDDEFYGGVGKRQAQYRDWLRRHADFELDDFEGAGLGVAKDKSENVFVYVHNRNNRWAK